MEALKSKDARLYRSSKRCLIKKLARMILEQALVDLHRQGNPIRDRNKEHRDAKKFFEDKDYLLICECAEIDAGDVDNWYEGLDPTANGKSG